jgi:predicted Zn-dependent peptidase
LKYLKTKTKTKTKLLIKQTKQAYIYFGSSYDANMASLDNYKATVAHFVLGSSGFGSRLMEEIRVKRGLAYSAYSRVQINNYSSYFSGYLQTKVDAKDQAIKVIQDVISNFIKNGVTQQELDAAKKFILGNQPLRQETLSARLHKTFLEFYKGKEFGWDNKQLQLIKNLKLNDLNSYIKSHNEITKLSFAIVNAKTK